MNADQIQLILAEDARIENGRIANAEYLAVKIAELPGGAEHYARLYESVNPASDDERARGHPGAGAMAAVIEFRDLIRKSGTD